MKYLLCDVGGSSIKYAVSDENHNFTASGKVPTPTDTLEHFIEVLTTIYNDFKEEVSGLALSMPGKINPETGYMYSGGALPYIRDLDMIPLLQKTIPLKITIANDAKCAAMAELGYGCLKGIRDAVVCVLGTGIGGCVIINGKPVNGKNFSAGEFSMIQTDKDQFGFASCWAMLSGIKGLLQHVNEARNSTDFMSGEEIFQAANNHDEKILAGVSEYAKHVAFELYNLTAILNPEVIAIGGGISVQPLLISLISQHMETINRNMGYFFELPDIVPCKYFNDANLVGALHHHLQSN